MNRCVVCYKVIEECFSSLVEKEEKLCRGCYKNFKLRNVNFIIEGVKGFVLYYYDEYFRSLLYKYKGTYDYPLKDAFISYNLCFLKKRYKGYSLVLAPSNEKEIKERGFDHLEEIFKILELPIIKCFKKVGEWKQSSKNFEQRKDIQKFIKIDKKAIRGVKKVLLVDDVLTSGMTIKCLIRQIPADIDKKVLILSSNCRFVSNEFN